jgi:hypothetical protein
MATPLSSDLQRRKKESIMVEGYEVDCATEVTGTSDATQDILHVYGDDNPIMDINVNNSALTLTVYDKTGNNVLLDALQRLDPAHTGNKEYNWNNIYPTTVWINRKNRGDSQYLKGFFYKNWLPVPAAPAGDAAAKGTRTFAGNSEVMKEYNQPIIGEKIAVSSGSSTCTYTGTLKYTPLAVPLSSPQVNALRLVAIKEVRNGLEITSFEEEDLDITSSMINPTTKGITITATDYKILSPCTLTHAYVNYLYDKTSGIYPTVKATYPGKFDKNP